MNKIVNLVIGLLLIASTSALAQSPAEIRLGVGYGSFSMGDMKELQQNALNAIAVNARATDRFPAYFMYNLKYMFRSEVDNHFGIVAEMGSTGGRVGYSDYSGTYREDQLLRYRRLGIVVENYISLPKGFNGWLGLELSMLFSKLFYEGELSITGAGTVREIHTFYAWGGAVQPYIALERKIGMFRLGAQAGVCLNMSEGFRLKGERDTKLVNPVENSEDVAPAWSGWRLEMHLGIPLNTGRSNKEN